MRRWHSSRPAPEDSQSEREGERVRRVFWEVFGSGPCGLFVAVVSVLAAALATLIAQESAGATALWAAGLGLGVIGLAAGVALVVAWRRTLLGQRDEARLEVVKLRRELAELRDAQQRREAEGRVKGSRGTGRYRVGDGPISTSFLTEEAKNKAVSFGAPVQTVRFMSSADGPAFTKTEVRRADVPRDVSVGSDGVIVVTAFTHDGIMVDEENTYGQSINVEGYP